MGVIATAVEHLIAAGVSGEALVRAISDMEASIPKDAVAEKRRAYDRERKRDLNSGGIPAETAETAESAETPPLSLPPLLSPHTPQITPPAHTPPCRTRARTRAEPFVTPDWIPVEAWNGWLEMRISAKKPPTLRGMQLAVAKLEKLKRDGHDPGEVLDQSTQGNWIGLFPIKDESKNDRNKHTGSIRGGARSSPVDGFKSAIWDGIRDADIGRPAGFT